jgi:hypothetical protein
VSHDPDDSETIEEAQATICDGIERARELLCEAKLAMALQEQPKAESEILPD